MVLNLNLFREINENMKKQHGINVLMNRNSSKKYKENKNENL